jgi:hypothetical protein
VDRRQERTVKSPITIFVTGVVAAVAISNLLTAASPSANDTTTTTTSVDPPTVPGVTIQDPGYVVTYTVTDPTGVVASSTHSIGTDKGECYHLRRQLLADVGVEGSKVAPDGMIISAVSTCMTDPNSVTTDTTTTVVP